MSRILQRVPARVPGKARVARALLRSPEAGIIADRYGHTLAVPSLREPISCHLYANGEYEPEVVRLLRTVLRGGGVFVDVGASVGAHTLIASDLVGPAGRVIAVEPSPQVGSYLAANLELNGAANVSFEPCALSDRVGEADFYVPDDRHFGMATLVPRFHSRPSTIETRTLDELMLRFGQPKIDLLKVDVEGAESLVFRGGGRTLTGESPPVIVFEFADWAEQRGSDITPGDSQRTLHDYGYQIWELDAYLAGAPPLREVVTTGTCMLVARRG